MPVELAFVYYLPFYPVSQLLSVAILTAVVAQSIDYFIGKLIRPKKIVEFIGEKRIAKAESQIKRYGLLTIFVFNLFPLSSPVIALAAGMLKIDFKRFVLVSSLGLFLKYLILVLCFA